MTNKINQITDDNNALRPEVLNFAEAMDNFRGEIIE